MILIVGECKAQDTSKVDTDTSEIYDLWKDRFILYSSMGYSTGPFSLNYKFNDGFNSMKYRANMNPVVGLGFSYKWMALSFNIRLPGYIKNVREFGETEYADLGLKFNIKNVYFELDAHFYRGFALKNASNISETLTPDGINNWLRHDIGTASLSINSWYFQNKSYNLKAAQGIVGNYNQEASTPYLKGGINLIGFGADSSLVPFQYLDTTNSLIQLKGMSALDISAVPGYAYVNNINGWQFGFWAGLGLAAQIKFMDNQGSIRGGLGLRPRLDLNINGGYNIDDWFIIFNAKFDNKSIAFQGLSYRQQYYTINVMLGHRFGE